MPPRRRLRIGIVVAALWGVLLIPLAAYALDSVPPPVADAVNFVEQVAVAVSRLVQPPPTGDTATISDSGRIAAVYRTYSRVTNDAASIRELATASIILSATTTTVSSDTNPSTYGTPLTYTATTTASGGNPAGVGTVDFTDGGAPLCTAVPLSGNQATCIARPVVGSHAILASFSGTTRYTNSSGGLSQQVNPATLTVTADDKSKTYGDPNPTFTAISSGFVYSETQAVLGGALSFNGPLANSNAGTYTAQIVPSGLTSTNYQINYVNGTLTIAPARLTVTADDQSKVYGAPNPTFTAHYSPFLNGDTTASLSGALAISGPSAGSGVGTYALVPSGLSSTNYNISYVNGTLTVTPAALTLTADNASRLYGASNPGFTAQYSGFVNGDSSGSLGGALAFTAPGKSAAVGTYPGAIVPSGLTSANYSISYVGGTLTITPAPLTVSANDATRVYGAANPPFSVSFSGFVNSDGPASLGGSVAYGAPGAGSPVGTYSITPSGLTSTNYAITYANGRLTITPASVTVTVNDATRYYGQVNPSFSLTPSGLVNGDPVSSLGAPVFSTVATQTSNVGDYAVTVSGLSNSNYLITTAGGTLHVVKATTVTVLTSSPNPSMANRPVTLAVTVTPGAPGGLNPSAAGTVTISRGSTTPITLPLDSTGHASTTIATLPVGHDTLTAAYSGDGNFIGSVSSATVQVVKADMIVFSSSRDGNLEIYSIDVGTGFQTRLTNNPAVDTNPAYSPDGTRVAFVSTRRGTPQIWVMNADGTNPQQLTADPGIAGTPAWSPDGSQLAYSGTRSGSIQLWVARAAGPYPATSPRQLTRDSFAFANSTPAWSPDGQRIAFTSTHTGRTQIWVSVADGAAAPTQLVTDTAFDATPAWSPDGTQIAFSSTLQGLPAIYVKDLTTGVVRRLTNNGLSADATPSWSPDGSSITFTSTLGGIVEIYQITAGGTGQVRLTTGPAVNALPSWCCTRAP